MCTEVLLRRINVYLRPYAFLSFRRTHCVSSLPDRVVPSVFLLDRSPPSPMDSVPGTSKSWSLSGGHRRLEARESIVLFLLWVRVLARRTPYVTTHPVSKYLASLERDSQVPLDLRPQSDFTFHESPSNSILLKWSFPREIRNHSSSQNL